jgi:hypothetical protein
MSILTYIILVITMPDDENPKVEEEGIECVDCGDFYEDDAVARRVRNLVGEYVCQKCLAQRIRDQKEAEAKAKAGAPKPPAPAKPPK